MLPLNLPFTVLRVALRALEPVHLPPFPGSKLEGAFGRALYRLACIQPQRKTCQDCPLQAIYPYGLSYAPWLPEDLRVSSLGTPRPILFRVAYGWGGAASRAGREAYLRPRGGGPCGVTTALPAGGPARGERARPGPHRGRLELEEVGSIHPYTDEQVTLLQGMELNIPLSPILLQADRMQPH